MGVVLSPGGSEYAPVGRFLFNLPGIAAERKADLIRIHTGEGIADASAKGRLRRKQPTLTAARQRRLFHLQAVGDPARAELAALFGVARSTICRPLQRASLISQQGALTGCDGHR